jgi:hypothetical protein
MLSIKPPFSLAEYARMAAELEFMSDAIRVRHDMNHDFADRLANLATEMRQDCLRAHPPAKAI